MPYCANCDDTTVTYDGDWCDSCNDPEGESSSDGDDYSIRSGSALHTDGSARLVGVEWEYNYSKNGPGVAQWARTWQGGVHSDGSCGWEAVTPPIAGKHIEPCLTMLGKALKDAKIDKDCGLHVHVDARDFYWPDIVRLMALYAKVEPVLYAIGGDYRVRNTYCKPMGRIMRDMFAAFGHTREAVVRAVFNAGNESRSYLLGLDKKNGARYRGINLVPWMSQRAQGRNDQTIEFRIHRNAESAERVIGWARLCEAIVSYAATHTQAEIDALPRSPVRALALVSPESKGYMTRRLNSWRKSVKKAERRVVVKGRVWECAV